MKALDQKLIAVQDEVIRILTEVGDTPIVETGVNKYTNKEWRSITLKETISNTLFSIDVSAMDSIYGDVRGVYRITTSRDRKAHTRTSKTGEVNASKLLALVSEARSDCLREHNRAIASNKAYDNALEVRKSLGMDTWGSINVSGLIVDIYAGGTDTVKIKLSGNVNAEKAAAIVEALRNLELVTA